jgi:hypothetical protein
MAANGSVRFRTALLSKKFRTQTFKLRLITDYVSVLRILLRPDATLASFTESHYTTVLRAFSVILPSPALESSPASQQFGNIEWWHSLKVLSESGHR